MKKRYGIPGMLAICFHAAPTSMIFKTLLNVVSGLVPMLQALATALFIDTALKIVQKTAEYPEIVLPIVAVAGVVAVAWLGTQARNLCDARIRLRLRAVLRPEMTDKCARLEYRHIEDPKTWDLITRVTKKPEEELMGGVGAFSDCINLAFSVSGIIALLLAHVWWAALATVAFSVPLMFIAIKAGKANYQAQRETEREERVQDYIINTAVSREAAEERALFGYDGAMREKFNAAFERAWKVRYKTELKWFFRSKLSSVIFALISILIALTLLFPTVNGDISIGLFTSLVAAAFSLVNMLSWSLTYVFDELTRKREYMKDMKAFDELSETAGATDIPQCPPVGFESLDIRHVSFTYPGTDKKVLDDLSLSIKKGEHISFVGVNGAGKTTLVKLLTGLYDNYEGEILINGTDLRKFTQAQLKSMFAIVFQDFVRYEATVGQNITAELPGRDETALSRLGVELTADTELGRLTDKGRELSGGQWQRIAIARALANPAPVRMLDEPTSALDPIAESEIYRSFQEESRGVTTFFISHRLGSTKLADRICVLSEGRIAEEGDHAQLMRMGGLYAEMFESQRKWYE